MGKGATLPMKENGAGMHPGDGVAGSSGDCGFALSEGTGQKPPSLREWKSQAEQAYVRQVWDLSGEDVRKASETAGISRGHWYELMKKNGL